MKKQLESKFQADLIKELREMLPGALIFKNEGKQGLPDLTILYKKHWALLECKAYEKANHQGNQDTYVQWADENSFGRFIYPENKQEVLNELQQAFRVRRKTRSPKSQ